jgi:tetratricopeptide (TPR) repeat protein
MNRDVHIRDRDLELIDQARAAELANDFETALGYLDLALEYQSTPHAHWNRSQVLLALGRYPEGLEEAEWRWKLWPNLAGEAHAIASARAPLWSGEPIRGNSLVVYHEMGFGDTIMLLRYVPVLQEMGAKLTLVLPWPLHRLAAQFEGVEILEHIPVRRFNFRCPMFSLLRALQFDQGQYLPPPPYLTVDPALVDKWNRTLEDRPQRMLGVAWSGGGAGYISEADRSIPRPDFLRLLGRDEDALISLQQGVHFHFDDFADVAALASVMDEIIAVDTAALHVAGAIGHPNTYAMLRHSEIWRWRSSSWYPAIKRCRQDRPGDWASAFAKIPGPGFGPT